MIKHDLRSVDQIYARVQGRHRRLLPSEENFIAIICDMADKMGFIGYDIDNPLLFISSRDYEWLLKNVTISHLVVVPVDLSWDESWKLNLNKINNFRRLLELTSLARNSGIKTSLFLGGRYRDLSIKVNMEKEFDAVICDDTSLTEFVRKI